MIWTVNRLANQVDGTQLWSVPSNNIRPGGAMASDRERRIEVGVPALPTTFEIGLGNSQMEMKPTLYDSLVGYKTEPYPGGISGAAIRRPDRFEGRLAESWAVSDDGRTVELTLRDGVLSVAGNELTAEDVKYTLDRGFNVPGYYRWTAEVAGLASNESVSVVDRRTVRFQLSTPSAFFLDTRVFPMNGIFDSSFVRLKASADDPWSLGFLESHDAGFGPYQLADVVPGARMVFRARKDYYRGKPAFDEIVYNVIGDLDDRVHRMVLGQLDYAHGLPISSLLRLRERASIRVVFGPSTNVFLLTLRCKDTPLANVHLRRAIAYAVPYDQILKQVFFGVARPWRGLIPPVIDGYDETRWPYSTDAARAREELQLAGSPSDFRLRILGSAAQGAHRSAGQRIVNSLEAVGLPAELNIVEPGEYAGRRFAGDYVACLCEAGPMVPDAGYALSHDFCSDSEGNDFGYCNPELDDLVARGLGELNPTRRLHLYRKAQDILAADVPAVPIASPGFMLAINRRIAGVAWYPDSVLHFGELSPGQ